MSTRGRVSGGLTLSDTLTQIQADITGKRIHVLAESETTALGAVIVATTALGFYSSLEGASEAIVKVRKTFEPNSENIKAYDGLFAQWRLIYLSS
jgi:xylulokinase